MRTSRLASTVAVLCVALALASGCKSKKKSSGDSASASASASAAPAAMAPGVDADLMAKLQAIATNCTIQEGTGIVGECQGSEAASLAADIRKGTVKRVEALATMAEAVHSEDAKLRAAAANTLYTSFRATLGEAKVGDVTPATAQRLQEAVTKLDERQGSQIAPAATHAAFLAGTNAEFLTAVEAGSKRVQREVYRHLMTYGGMAVFPKIQEVVAARDVAPAVNALESARKFESSNPADRKTICTWAQGLLTDARSQVSGKAGTVLVECGAEFVDALLAEGKKRLADKTFDAPFARAFSFGCMQRRLGQVAEEETPQCKETRALLEAVLKDKDVKPGAKVPVIMSLARQWPDDRTKKLVAKYKKSEHKTLSVRAAAAEQRIESSIQRAADREKAIERARQQGVKDREAAKKGTAPKAPAAPGAKPKAPAAPPAPKVPAPKAPAPPQ